jgi:hypothetical protein
MSADEAARYGCQGPARLTLSPCSNLVFAGSVRGLLPNITTRRAADACGVGAL